MTDWLRVIGLGVQYTLSLPFEMEPNYKAKLKKPKSEQKWEETMGYFFLSYTRSTSRGLVFFASGNLESTAAVLNHSLDLHRGRHFRCHGVSMSGTVVFS